MKFKAHTIRLLSPSVPLSLILPRMRSGLVVKLGEHSHRVGKRTMRMVGLVRRYGCCAVCGVKPTHLVYGALLTRKGTTKDPRLMFVMWDPHLEEPVYFNVDHIRPKAKGGRDRVGNYRLTCEPCNTAHADEKAPPYHWLRYRKLCVEPLKKFPQTNATMLEVVSPPDIEFKRSLCDKILPK